MINVYSDNTHNITVRQNTKLPSYPLAQEDERKLLRENFHVFDFLRYEIIKM